MGVIRIAGYERHSSVNGPGVRFVLFTQGCPHGCKGCHNPDTWDFHGGTETDTRDIISLVRDTRYLDGFTFSGGEPLLQAEACTEIAAALREDSMRLWLYTGYTYEAVVAGAAGEAAKDLLPYIDIMVDGRFEEGLKSDTCLFRGSANQRLIDVKASLAAGEAAEAKESGIWG